jgi:hypothetical protein
MNTVRRRGATALTAAIALALGGIPAAFTTSSILAAGEGTTTLESAEAGGSAYVDAGWLAVQTGATNRTTFTKTSLPTTTEVENLYGVSSGPNGCLLSTSSTKLVQDESLLTISGHAPGSTKPDAASLANGSIGAAEKKSGTSCSEVDSPDETLTLALNPAQVKGHTGPMVASSASLDLDLKGSVQLLATASLRGQPAGTFELNGPGFTGTNIAGATLFLCPATTAADSGSDSGPNDNCRWPISDPSWLPDGGDDHYFDTLVITTLSGSFSLEGGADGVVEPAPPAPFPAGSSVFELAEQYESVINCGETVEELAIEAGEPNIKVTRLGEGSEADCDVSVPYTLSNFFQKAQFLKPLDAALQAEFRVEITWTAPAGTGPADLDATTIDFEEGEGEKPMAWCPAPAYDADGLLTGIAGTISDMSGLDGTQFSCLATREASVERLGGVDTVTADEQIYLLGDAAWRP